MDRVCVGYILSRALEEQHHANGEERSLWLWFRISEASISWFDRAFAEDGAWQLVWNTVADICSARHKCRDLEGLVSGGHSHR